jgi:hypothetical protein
MHFPNELVPNELASRAMSHAGDYLSRLNLMPFRRKKAQKREF